MRQRDRNYSAQYPNKNIEESVNDIFQAVNDIKASKARIDRAKAELAQAKVRLIEMRAETIEQKAKSRLSTATRVAKTKFQYIELSTKNQLYQRREHVRQGKLLVGYAAKCHDIFAKCVGEAYLFDANIEAECRAKAVLRLAEISAKAVAVITEVDINAGPSITEVDVNVSQLLAEAYQRLGAAYQSQVEAAQDFVKKLLLAANMFQGVCELLQRGADLPGGLAETIAEEYWLIAECLAIFTAGSDETLANAEQHLVDTRSGAAQSLDHARAELAKELAQAQQDYVVRFTPVQLRDLLVSTFAEYRDKNMPANLKEDSQMAAVPTSNLGWGAYFKRGIATMASVAASKTRTHAVVTQFIEMEMTLLLSQKSASAIKTMTDMTILFYGLREYIRSRSSTDLKPILLNIQIWPKGYHCQALFQERFKAQIICAKELISANTTLWDKAKCEKARYQNNTSQPIDIPYGSAEIGDHGDLPTASMGDEYNQYLAHLGESGNGMIKASDLSLDFLQSDDQLSQTQDLLSDLDLYFEDMMQHSNFKL